MIRFNTSYNGSELTGYEKADLYTDGISHYTQLFRDIREAKTCIFIEFYTIHHDVVGKKLIEALTARAAEGVQVWVMCDFIANLSTPEKMFAPLREAGEKESGKALSDSLQESSEDRVDRSQDFIHWRYEHWKAVCGSGQGEDTLERYAGPHGGSLHRCSG